MSKGSSKATVAAEEQPVHPERTYAIEVYEAEPGVWYWRRLELPARGVTNIGGSYDSAEAASEQAGDEYPDDEMTELP